MTRCGSSSKWPALVCVLPLLIGALTSCVAKETSDPDTLRLALKTAPNQLDPAMVVDVGEGELCALVYEGLVRFAPDGTIVPGVASSWSVSDDGVVYTFDIDPNAKFANGRRVTANDIAFSFGRVLSPESRSSRRWVLDRLADVTSNSLDGVAAHSRVTVSDTYQVKLVLREPFAPFLSLLALPAAMIVPPEAFEQTADGWRMKGFPQGAGPWHVVQWERADRIVLERNPHDDVSADGVKRLDFRIIPEAFTRVAEFESGRLDVLEVPPAEVNRYVNDAEAKVLRRAELRVFYIGLNNQRPPLDNVEVRRALNMAVDVDKLVEVLTDGHGHRATGSIPPGLPGHQPRAPHIYNPDAARRLLAKNGLDKGFALEIWQRDNPESNRMLEAVQGYLSEVGIKATIVRREWSAFKEAVSAGKVDAFFLDWFADYPDAENFIFPLFHSSNAGGGGNRAFVNDPEIDALIVAASKADHDDAAKLYAQIDDMLYQRAPWIYLYFPTVFYAVGDGVQNFQLPTLYLGANYLSVSKTL